MSSAESYRPFEVAREAQAIEAAMGRAEEMMAAKGYPDARAAISLARELTTPRRLWNVALYHAQFAPRPLFVGSYGSALKAILALAEAVEGIEPKPRPLTVEEIKATLGVIEYAQAAE